MDNTVESFWQMVIENNSSLIIMLCRCMEEGKDKSLQYFPSGTDDELTYGAITIKCKKEKEKFNGLFIRKFEVIREDGGSPLLVTHL